MKKAQRTTPSYVAAEEDVSEKGLDGGLIVFLREYGTTRPMVAETRKKG